MKRKAFCALCALILALTCICLPAFAEETEYFMYDVAEIISDAEEIRFNDAAKEVSLRYGCGVYIAVFDDMAEYGYEDMESFSDAVYSEWALGIGEDGNGILLVMSMADQNFFLLACGDLASEAFSEDAMDALAGAFIDNFEAEDWAGGFDDFIAGCDHLLGQAQSGDTAAPSAEETRAAETSAETTVFVYDLADLLSDAEERQLNEAAKDVSMRYGCGVYIAVFDDMADYGYHNIESFAEAVYAEWNLGLGADRTCISLVMSMSERDYDLCAHGDFAHTAFTDYGKEVLADEFKDNFRRDDWAGGFSDYIDQCSYMLGRAEQGDPIDVPSGGTRVQIDLKDRLLRNLGPGVIVGIIIAFVYCGILKGKMKSAKIAREASAYIAPSGIRMQAEDDMFTHTTVTRQHIERDHDRGGHGGTSVNSGGFSHSSGKF